jgi:hypothetical protein
MSEVVHEHFSFAAEVAQLAPIVYHSDRLGRLVCSHLQVYPIIFKTLSKKGTRKIISGNDCKNGGGTRKTNNDEEGVLIGKLAGVLCHYESET